jgi:hypothetical protein
MQLRPDHLLPSRLALVESVVMVAVMLEEREQVQYLETFLQLVVAEQVITIT